MTLTKKRVSNSLENYFTRSALDAYCYINSPLELIKRTLKSGEATGIFNPLDFLQKRKKTARGMKSQAGHVPTPRAGRMVSSKHAFFKTLSF